MFTKFPPNIQGIILAFFGFACFSMADTAAKWLTDYYPTFQIIGFNAVITVGTCLVLSKPLGGLRKSFQTNNLRIHIARGLCNTIISLLVVFSLSQLPLTTVYTLIFIAPFITTLMAIPIFKERVDAHGWISIILGFAGVFIVMRPGFTEFNPWLFLPILSAIFISALFLLARPLTQKETLLSLALFPAIANFVLILPVAWFFYGLPQLVHVPVFLIAGMAIIGGLTFTALAFRIGKASIVSPVQYSQILWGVGIGYFLFHDIPDLWTMIGAAIIIGSGIYLLETERRLKTPQTPVH